MTPHDWSYTDAPCGLWADAWRPAIRLAGLYLFTATAWIVSSDWIVHQVNGQALQSWQLQTLKGMGFVVVTSVLLLSLVYPPLAHLTRSRQALARSRRVLHTLLGNLPGMAYRCLNDERWTALIVSEGAKDLTGHDAAEFRSGRRSLTQIIYPEDLDRIRQQVERAVEQQTPYCLEYRILRADGAVRWTWEQGRPIYDDHGKLEALEGFIIDIHERKRAEQLERERRQLVETRRAMERELGVIGHEMRTPLASLRAVAEVLMTESNTDLTQQEQLVRAIHDETIRMTEMANNMLEAARLRQAGMSGQWADVSLEALCDSAATVVRPLLDPSRITLDTQIDTPDLTMRGDFSSLRRLLINLLSNAVRHTHDGSIRIIVRDETDDQHRYVRLTIQDTGEGIHPDRAKLLGVAFALHGGRADHNSAGLGLTICRDIARSHGGHISFHSTPEEGTSFHIRLRAELESPHEACDAGEIEREAVLI